MKKAMKLCGLILLLIVIGSLFVCVVSAEEIIIDTEKGVPGFRTEPARDLPANWQYVQDHPDTSADGWFNTYAYPPGQGNGSFWYTISFPDMGECKGIWETSVPYMGKYEVFVWIPSPDPFDPYLDEATPPSDYLPTKRAQYKVFHNEGVATVTIDQNVNMGRFTSLGVFEFDSTARVELSGNGVEFWRCVAFDAVKFVPVVNDMVVTDVTIIPPTTSIGQSTLICMTVTNEGTQQEANVSVKAFVDGAQVGSTKYVSLDPGVSDTMTILWIPRAAKNYSVEGVVGVVSGETDTGDNRKAIEVGVLAMPIPINQSPPIFDRIQETIEENGTQRTVSETYTFITKWGSHGTGEGQFDIPNGIAVDSSGNLYIADGFNYRIQKFDPVGNFITKWGEEGIGEGQFDIPCGIAVASSGYVYVADTHNDRIQKFDSVGNFITKWGSWGYEEGEFIHPWGIAVDSCGYVYVADTDGHRIQKFDSDGNFVTKWGSPGTGDGEFGFPYDIAVDNSGYVFVCDSSFFERIQKFDSDGNFITKWGSRGTGDGEFRQPNGIAVDSSGNVFVADTVNDRIQKFDSDGNFITKWGSQGNGEGEFLHPCGIVVDSSGNVYVADSENNRIQKFAPGSPAHPPTVTIDEVRYGNVNEPIQFYSFVFRGTPPYEYEWEFYEKGTSVIKTEQNPTHTWSNSGTYSATLRVQDSAGLWSEPKVGRVFISDSLIAKYAPVVYLHKDEKFYPTVIEALLTYSDLKTKDETIVGPITVDQLMAHNDEDTYLDSILINRAGILSGNAPDPNYFTLYPINIYARKKTDIGRTALQYWFFYTYNQGKVNAHEGDWEMFQILLDSDENPDRVTYSWHVPYPPFVYGGKTYEWSEVEKVDNTHPKVYVNKGSHANNKEPKLLQSSNWYSYIPKTDTLTVIDDPTQWVNWKGKWGQQVMPSFSGGVGPKYGSIKYEIADKIYTIYRWQAPALWALICSDGHYEIIPDSPVNIHIYDKNNNHVGINENGTFDCEIPGVYYIDLDSEPVIYIANTSKEYRIFAEATEEGEFGLTIEHKEENETAITLYQNIAILKNTTANLTINQTTTNYTMEIDSDGDGTVDETKSPDLIETDYAPTATINYPVNNSIYPYCDEIVFNGTGIDVEDGTLTNSSLVWWSSIDGCIGIGNGFNTTNLTAGTHIIELTVNDSSGQTDTDNVTLTVITPDLAVTNIAFSNPQPIEGEAVTINATIDNLGTANAADVTVQFFDGTPANGTQIGTNQTIATLNAGENETVSVVWDSTGEAGDNSIWVVADPADTIKEPEEENNQASKSIFVRAPDVLHIVQAQTDRAAYLGNEAVTISCIVQNASGNISANVSAEIAKPDSGLDNITLAEGIVGYYYGTFTNTSLSGCYNVTIYANRTGFVGDTESLCFEVLDTTPPASVTNITNTSGPTWINWTWDNPLDPDFDHTLIYLNGSWKTATAGNCYFADGLNATTEYEIATRTVDADGNINATWVNQTAATISPCFIATAAYGTALHEDIDVLRDFRDEYLMPNPVGQAVVKIYYTTSPPIADVIRENEGLRTAVRAGLVKPLVHITGMFVG